MKRILSGNEAVALGAFESGVKIASAYPGTPSTEILQHFASYEKVYAEWAPNEKVAMEVAIGASMTGTRAMTTMKHVGLNVAADPLMTLSYTGIRGGLVIVCADDPGMHSSQNEQDNRFYAQFAKIPMLEPADSQESRDMIPLAVELSEKFDTPVMVRMTTRISHGKSVVQTKSVPQRQSLSTGGFKRDIQKFVMLPGYARMRHPKVLEREANLKDYTEKTPLNTVSWGKRKVGVITSGVSYQYVKEIVPHLSILKLGLTWPLPENKIRDFAGKVEQLYVVEELEPYIEAFVNVIGINVKGKQYFPITGELTPDVVAQGFKNAGVFKAELPKPHQQPGDFDMPRPPLMCAACPHRGLFYALKKLKGIVHGDIGCYTLGAVPPLNAMDSCVCMGASISMAHGSAKAMQTTEIEDQRPIFATIGDSTFFHTGINSLIDVVYNNSNVNVIILDNHITAMTGAQENPGSGKTLQNHPAHAIEIEPLVRALGVQRVRAINPYDIKATTAALKEESGIAGPSVLICRGPCLQVTKTNLNPVHTVEQSQCIGCAMCLRLGCPAIYQGQEIPLASDSKDRTTKRYAAIDPTRCYGCTLCAQVCKPKAICPIPQ